MSLVLTLTLTSAFLFGFCATADYMGHGSLTFWEDFKTDFLSQK